MSFEDNYLSIKNIVKNDLNVLESEMLDLFLGENPLDAYLSEFLTRSAKRLRPVLALLFLHSLGKKINKSQLDVLLAVELIHNATLIHDDVIDKADKRRDKDSFNAQFDDNLAVVAGDYLLSIAMEKIISTDSIEVLKIFASALKMTCRGEINQYFSKFTVPTLDEYIEKSKNKTALLFQVAISGALMLDETCSNDLKNSAQVFSENFGIAFQIRDDIKNVLNYAKIENPDIALGIYTAPVIFAHQENKSILESENIFSDIKEAEGIEKAKILMDNYFYKSLSIIENQQDNSYKKAIYELIELLRDSL